MNNTNIHLGRQYLHEAYAVNYGKQVKSAIGSYYNSSNFFHQHLDICRNSGKHGTFGYDMRKHDFSIPYGNYTHKNSPIWERNHLLYRVENFAKQLFDLERGKADCVKEYLYNKLGVDKEVGPNVDEKKLRKLFDKIEKGKFKTQEEKEAKKKYLASDQYKIETLKVDLGVIQKKITKNHENFNENYRYFVKDNQISTIDVAIAQINERLKSGISENGRKILNKTLTVLEKISSAIENNTSFDKIDFKPLLESKKQYCNTLNKDKTIECIDKIYDFSTKLNELIEEKQQISDQLKELENPKKAEPAKENRPEQVDLADAEVEKPASLFTRMINSITGFFRSLWNGFLNLFTAKEAE